MDDENQLSVLEISKLGKKTAAILINTFTNRLAREIRASGEIRRIAKEIYDEDPSRIEMFEPDKQKAFLYFLTPLDPIEVSDAEDDLPSTLKMKQFELAAFIASGIPEAEAREIIDLPDYVPACPSTNSDRDYVPTPAEIEQRAAKIREGWSDKTYDDRANGGTLPIGWQAPGCEGM